MQDTPRMPACLGEAALARIAAGQPAPDEAARAHLASCGACQQALIEIKADNEFLAAACGDAAADLGTLVSADLVPGYQILGEIHWGGQGVVYKAIQSETRRKVAIKLLLQGRSAGTRQRIRFEQEIALAASLRHPHIVAVHDSVHPRDGSLGYAMEYVSGRPLDHWAREGWGTGEWAAPSLDQKVRLFVKVCDAVQYAHRHGVIHRDLKPGNILVDADGEPRVCDFGVAINVNVAGGGPRTVTGEFVGTLAYASPEQVSGSPDDIDTRSDVYSLGVVLYEAIVGRMPYAVDGPFSEAVRNIVSASPGRPQAAGVRLGTDLETIILKALAKEPERRYQSAVRLGDDLRRSLSGEAIEARRSSGWYVMRKAARRHRLPVIVGAGVLALIVAAGIRERVQASRLRLALSESRIGSGRALAQAGSAAEAAGLLWRELLDPAGPECWAPDEKGLPTSRAWWALWQLYAAHPCARTVRSGSPRVFQSLTAMSGHDQVLTTDLAGSISICSLWDLSPVARLPAAAGPAPDPLSLGVRNAVCTPAGEIVCFHANNTIGRYRRDGDSIREMPGRVAMPNLVWAGYGSALAPDGRLLAARIGEEMSLIDTESGKIVPPRLADSGSARYPISSPDGQWIAYVAKGVIDVRSVQDGRLMHSTPRDTLGAAFTAAQQVGEGEGSVKLAFAPGEPAGAPMLYVLEGRTIFAIGGPVTGGPRQVGTIESGSQVVGLSVSPDGEWCAAQSADRRVSIWATQGPRESFAAAYLAGHDADVLQTMFTPDSRSLLSSDRAGTIKQWDVPAAAEHPMIRPLTGHGASVFAIAMAPSGGGKGGGSTWVYTASADHTVRAWDPNTGTERSSSTCNLGNVVDSVAVSPDGGRVAAAIRIVEGGITRRSDIVLFNAALEQTGRIDLADAHVGRCADLAFSPDGKTLASAGDDGVKLWNAVSGKPIKSMGVQNPRKPPGEFSQARSVRFSPSGRLVAWGDEGGVAHVATADLTLPRAFASPTDMVRCVRFSPDGQRLATAGNDFTIRLWDTASGRLLRAMQGQFTTTFGLDFSPDGRVLASCSADGTVRLWNAATGTPLATLRDDAAYPHWGPNSDRDYYAVAFLPDGQRLIVAGSQGYLAVWDLRAFDRHIAGNAGYWIDRLQEEGRPSPIAKEARRWAETHWDAVEKK